MASREPLPRFSHAAVGIGSKLYVWGGESSRSKVKSQTLEIFDVPSVTWEQPNILHGPNMPDGLRNMAVTSDGRNSYSFGGATGSSYSYTYHNTLFQITPSHEELQPTSPSHTAPKGATGSCILQLKDKLLLHGGYTGERWTNDLHFFDLKKRVWALQPTTGDGPPPLTGHTFTRIDEHRAVVFGGDIGGFIYVNDTHVLDMETWHWTNLEIKGKKPPARWGHATCCIAGPSLMVIGGIAGGEPVGDAWLLDVDKGVWSEVTLPVAITPRYGHSVTVFGSGASTRVVVLFGGYNFDFGGFLSETTLLLLELRGGSWQVTRVVKPHELRRPDESLREQMRKLELSPQEGGADAAEQNLREKQEGRAEAERQVQLLEQGLADSEQLIRDLTQQAEDVGRRAAEAEDRSREREEQDGGEVEGGRQQGNIEV